MTTITETKEYIISVLPDRRFCADDCPFLNILCEDTHDKRVFAAVCKCFSHKTHLEIIPERSLMLERDMANNVTNVRGEQPLRILRSLRCVEAQEEK